MPCLYVHLSLEERRRIYRLREGPVTAKLCELAMWAQR